MDCDARIAELLAVPAGQRTFGNTVLAVEEARAAVSEARAAWCFLAAAYPDRALRETAREWGERLDKRKVGIDLDAQVYRAVGEYAASARATALSDIDARLLGDLLRDYRRSGFELPLAQRERIRVLLDELVELGSAFRASLDEWKDGIVVDRDELEGLSSAFVDGLERVEGGFRVSLDYPELYPFLAEARSSERRRELVEKEARKGGPENVARVERALVVRHEIAEILGYPSWAAYVTETRMARTPEAVVSFLDDLRERATIKAAADLAEMADANEDAGGSRQLRLWDVMYAQNQLKQQRYAVDEQKVAEYLPLQACLQGMFETTGTVLGIRFEEVPDASVWHPDVLTFDVFEFFDIFEAEGDAPFARFHLDLFPRPDKYKHAMESVLRPGRRLPDGSYQEPVAVMLATSPAPAPTGPRCCATANSSRSSTSSATSCTRCSRGSSTSATPAPRRNETSSKRRPRCSSTGAGSRPSWPASPATIAPASRCRGNCSPASSRPRTSPPGSTPCGSSPSPRSTSRITPRSTQATAPPPSPRSAPDTAWITSKAPTCNPGSRTCSATTLVTTATCGPRPSATTCTPASKAPARSTRPLARTTAELSLSAAAASTPT